MKKENEENREKSKCCHASVRVVGMNDFIGSEDIGTLYYECKKCGKPCDAILLQKELLKYKQEFKVDLQNRACRMDLKHDYHFSHYETDYNPSTTCAYYAKYAVMICRHCGNYIRQIV